MKYGGARSLKPSLEVAQPDLENEALPEKVRVIARPPRMVAEEGLQLWHLQVPIDARRGRQHLVYVILAQFIAQPAADRNSEAALETGECFGSHHVLEGLFPQP